MNLINFFNLSIFIIFILLFTSAKSGPGPCYLPLFLNISWNDTPVYKVNITADNEGNVRTFTWVSREISKPIVNVMATLKDVNHNRETVLYNITVPSCQIRVVLSRLPVMEQIFQAFTKKTNFTLNCPLKPGNYFMESMDFDSRNSVLGFLYRANVRYAFTGGVFEEAKNKTLINLMSFNVIAKITKKFCK